MDLVELGPWPWARALKFLGLAWLAVGLVGAVVPGTRRARLVATYGYAVPGFVVTYAAGWWLMKMSGRALTTPWLFLGALAGLAALHCAFLASHRERPRAVTTSLAWGSGAAALAVMSLRTEAPLALALVASGGLGLGGLAARPWASDTPAARDEDHEVAWRGLRALTWLEGGSLLLMVLVAMPLRGATGIRLDGGTGLLGWTHGVLVVLFLQALASSCALFGWPRRVLALGVLSALVPGGNFWLERHLRRRRAATPSRARPPEGQARPAREPTTAPAGQTRAPSG